MIVIVAVDGLERVVTSCPSGEDRALGDVFSAAAQIVRGGDGTVGDFAGHILGGRRGLARNVFRGGCGLFGDVLCGAGRLTGDILRGGGGLLRDVLCDSGGLARYIFGGVCGLAGDILRYSRGLASAVGDDPRGGLRGGFGALLDDGRLRAGVRLDLAAGLATRGFCQSPLAAAVMRSYCSRPARAPRMYPAPSPTTSISLRLMCQA